MCDVCLLTGVCAGCVVLENQLVSSVWGLVEEGFCFCSLSVFVVVYVDIIDFAGIN